MKNTLSSLVLILFISFSAISQGKVIPQIGHQDNIMHAKFSPDGKYLATGASDRLILLWDMQTGLHWTLTGHSGIIYSIAFNADGSLLATSDAAGQVILWDVATKSIKKRFAVDITVSTDLIVGELRFLPNGKELLYSANKLRKWNFVKDTHESYDMSGFAGTTTFALTADGKMAIGTSKKDDYINGQFISTKKFEFYDLKAKKFTYNSGIKQHGADWSGLVMSPDSKYLALINEKKILILTYPKGNVVQSFNHSEDIAQMTFSSNNRNLILSSRKGKILFCNLSTGDVKTIGGVTMADVTGGRMAYDPVNELIVGMQETDLVFYDINQGEIFKKFDSGNAGVYGLSWDEKAKKLWVLTSNSIVEWDIASLNIYKATFSTKNNTGGSFALSKELKTITEKPYVYFNRESNISTVPSSKESSKYKISNHSEGNYPDTKNGFKITDKSSGNVIAKKTEKGDGNIPIGTAISPNSKYAFVATLNALTIYNLPSLSIAKKIDYPVGAPATLAISPDGKTLVVGKTSETAWYGADKALNFDIDLFDMTTLERKGTLKGHYSTVLSFAFSKDGSKLFSGSWDGTIRVWNMTTKKQVALLHGSSPSNYFITSSDGYFTMSKNAIKKIAYGTSSAIYPASIFEAKLNRPDKVAAAIGFTPSTLQYAFAKAYKKRIKQLGVDDSPIDFSKLPTVSVLTESIPKNTTESQLKFKIEALGNGSSIKAVKIKVNNVPEFGANGLAIKSTSTYQKYFSIDLSRGMNNVSVSVINEQGLESMPATFSIKCNKETKPDLYLLTIGVSLFADSEYNLTYAAKDASDLQQFFQTRKSDYNAINVKSFTDLNAIKEKILASKSFFENAKVDDEVVVFVASHGLLDDNMDYYLAMSDMVFENPSFRGLKYEELESMFAKTKSRNRLMLIDACHSGEVDKEDTELGATASNKFASGVKSRGFKTVKSKSKELGLKNSFQLMKELFADMRSGSGITVISSASGTEFAYESEAWNNGVFTYALINGMKSSDTDQNRDDVISVTELKSYVFSEVDKLTNGKQHPTSRIENLDNDFTVVSLASASVAEYDVTGRFANDYVYYGEKRQKFMEVTKNGVDIDVYYESLDYNKEWQKSSRPRTFTKIAPNKYQDVSGDTLEFTADGKVLARGYNSNDYYRVR